MNKIATYLNEHLIGEVTSARLVRKHYSTDASILTVSPETVVFPRTTNDIRKVARFTWQLAEKGHPIGITARGLGNDTTGAAIGKGIIINTAKHLTSILDVSQKDRLVHTQGGVKMETLKHTLKWQGLAVADIDGSLTIGGAIANDAQGTSSAIGDYIEKLEVVLANGDLIETSRISRRDVNKKRGLQTLEGEIYRKISAIVEDNQDVIARIAADDTRDNTGYRRIADVRKKDGSFDLTPLFIGSQGTLGVISEAVLQADFYAKNETIAIIPTQSLAQARDLTDQLKATDPTELTIYDGELFRKAAAEGAQFPLVDDIEGLGALILLRFNDFSERTQSGKLKKVAKIAKNASVPVIDSKERENSDFQSVLAVTHSIIHNDKDAVVTPIIDGSFIPSDRREEFEKNLLDLAHKHHVELPVVLNALTGTYQTFPELKLDVVSDKQKLFRLITDYATLVDSLNGAFTSATPEGRLKSNAAWGLLEEDEAKLFEEIREAFDPFGTLNPGVKQPNELRGLVSALRPSYDTLRQLP